MMKMLILINIAEVLVVVGVEVIVIDNVVNCLFYGFVSQSGGLTEEYFQ